MRSTALEPALVEAFRRGEDGARDRLLTAVVPVVLQWCARLGGPRVDPEDAAHDVCIVVLGRIGTLDDAERLPGWLFGITRRVLAQHRRRAWFARWVPGLAIDPADPHADPRHDAESAQTSRRVRLALEDLSPAHREVLVLFDLEERTETEVAEILDIPLGTARSRLRAAREAFRRSARRHQLVAPVVELAREGRS